MIYAIRAVGTEFVKFGKAKSVGKRLQGLETGCPFELHIEAVADWADGIESAIHQYLAEHCQKFEWFRDSDRTAQVIAWMNAGEDGLREFKSAFVPRTASRFSVLVSGEALRRAKIERLPKEPRKQARVKKAPILNAVYDESGVNERLEQIKLRVIERLARRAA